MKYIILCTLVFVTGISFSQNHEIDVNYRIGTDGSNFKVFIPNLLNRYDHKHMRTSSDWGFLVNYKYQIWKKRKLFVSGGLEFSQSTHYQPIFDGGNGAHLDNIIINKNRFVMHFGVNKQFSFYDNKLILDLGIHATKRFYGSQMDVYSSDYTSNNEDWLEYRYELTTYYDKNHHASGIPIGFIQPLNLELNATVKFNVYKNLFLNVGLSYTRNNIFFYDYSYDILYYHNNSSTPTASYSFLGLAGNGGQQYGVRDQFVYLNAGLSYKFNWKK